MIPGSALNWITVNPVQQSNLNEKMKQNIMTTIRFAKFSYLIATVFLLATAAAAPGAVVTTDGFQLKLNGQPFVIKGMNYSPVPSAQPRAIFPMAITSFRITPMFGSLTSTKCAKPALT